VSIEEAREAWILDALRLSHPMFTSKARLL
jgi:hypothetical protein